MTIQQLIDQLLSEGGAIVSSNDCSIIEIADAQATGRFSVDANGFGFVRRYKEWLELTRNQAAIKTALEKIARYDEEPIWCDDRDDAAIGILHVARVALGEEEE